MYTVDKNLPGMPLAPKAPSKYPFRQMDVGDSFFVADPTAESRLRAAASHPKTRQIGKFVVRKEREGYRVWRIA